MRKISVSFLVGFTMIAGIGAASAQGAPDTMSNSVAARVSSMDGMRAKVTLSETKSANPYAATASSLGAAPVGQGTAIDVPVVNAKIGSKSDFSFPSNALMDQSKDSSVNVAANALQAPGQSSDQAGMQAGVVLGAGAANLSNMVGDQIRSSERLGK